MNQPAPISLLSERLLLRRLEHGDASALCSYRSLPEVARYQSWESFGYEEAARLIADQAGREPGVPGTWFQMAIVHRATHVLIGDCGLHCPLNDAEQMELGVTLAPTHQGQGYATEAFRTVLEFIFGKLELHRVFAVTAVDNAEAVSLFRRLGFRQEAHFIEHRWYKGNWDSEFVFAMLKREWEAIRSPRGIGYQGFK
jgi:RimJ/RimL family protein N-acetyltransferase